MSPRDEVEARILEKAIKVALGVADRHFKSGLERLGELALERAVEFEAKLEKLKR